MAITKEEAAKRISTMLYGNCMKLPTKESLGYLEKWIYPEDVEALKMSKVLLEREDTPEPDSIFVNCNAYKEPFRVACSLINGDNLYGIDSDVLFEKIMEEKGCCSYIDICNYIVTNIDRFSDDGAVRMKAIERLGY